MRVSRIGKLGVDTVRSIWYTTYIVKLIILKGESKMKAKLTSKRGSLTPNGQHERIMQIRAGEKGTGQPIGPAVTYWPWSSASCDQADKIIAEVALNNDLDLDWDDSE